MPVLRLLLALSFVAAILSLDTGSAYAWPVLDSSPQCDARWVARELKFSAAIRFHRLNEVGLKLEEIINPTLTYERQRDEYHDVGRQFCHAVAVMSDGSRHDMWYLIARPWGFAGIPGTDNVEFCISGLDPWHVYGKDCSTIRDTLGW